MIKKYSSKKLKQTFDPLAADSKGLTDCQAKSIPKEGGGGEVK